jgi:putative membrane protein
VLLIVGLLRVTYFEKGPGYYWHDAFFLIKFAAFVFAALLSIYPTAMYLSWSRGLKAGTAPEIPAERTRRVRLCLMLQLTAILVILLCAALMARGFGYLR